MVKGILDSRTITNPSKRAELHFDKGFPSVVIRGPHAAAIEPRSIPTLKPGEILVRVAFVGICATDLEIFEGRLGYYKTGMAKYPIVPGHELSGTVVSLGKKVTTLEEGDRVVVECIQGCGACPDCQRDSAITCRERREVGVMGVDGGYAEYLVTRARYAHKVPATSRSPRRPWPSPSPSSSRRCGDSARRGRSRGRSAVPWSGRGPSATWPPNCLRCGATRSPCLTGSRRGSPC